MQSGIMERKMGIKKWGESLMGVLKMVLLGVRYAVSSLIIHNST